MNVIRAVAPDRWPRRIDGGTSKNAYAPGTRHPFDKFRTIPAGYRRSKTVPGLQGRTFKYGWVCHDRGGNVSRIGKNVRRLRARRRRVTDDIEIRRYSVNVGVRR